MEPTLGPPKAATGPTDGAPNTRQAPGVPTVLTWASSPGVPVTQRNLGPRGMLFISPNIHIPDQGLHDFAHPRMWLEVTGRLARTEDSQLLYILH